MEFVHNYVTVDQYFKVFLPVEFNLLFHHPSEIKRHRQQILKHRLMVFDLRLDRSSYRSLYIDDVNNRVFFTRRINKMVPNNTIYYLDELIKVK